MNDHPPNSPINSRGWDVIDQFGKTSQMSSQAHWNQCLKVYWEERMKNQLLKVIISVNLPALVSLFLSFPFSSLYHRPLHAHALLNFLLSSENWVLTPFTPVRGQLVQRSRQPSTTKPAFIDELCVSKLSRQQEFTETLKSLSATTGIFFNHYHSSETACPVLKVIQVSACSLCMLRSNIPLQVTDSRWFT